ncbi:hypothetical protein [Azospirillum argentinense]
MMLHLDQMAFRHLPVHANANLDCVQYVCYITE